MTQQFGIMKKGSQKLKLFYVLLFFGAILFCVLAVVTVRMLLFIPALLLFFFAVRLFLSRKRLLSQRIVVDDTGVTYYLNTGETSTLLFSELTFAGYYGKNPESEDFSGTEGLYLYSESLDQYCLAGRDFEHREDLYSLLKKKCCESGVQWRNIQKQGRNGLVQGLRRLLQEEKPESIL